MAYLNFQNCTKQEYEEVLYSQDAKNKIKILFNNTELEDADLYCEKLTVKSRILANGSKVFSLNNFISKELELILHDIDLNIIQNQVEISIGTFVNNTYEYVPIGIFNIQDQPTNDKNKTTIKLRDNSVKFDFNYNAQPIIEASGGTATKLQILQDICTKANVTCNINSFIGSTDLIGIYDNTITARQYISYIAESAGKIATINREGELIFVDINNLVTWNIPLSIVEKYEIGIPYRIGQVIYEDGVVRYETPSSNYDKLYIDASNPYITNQQHINSILQEVNNFEIDSATIGNILGNPAIDGYDLINIYNDKVEGNPTILKTLATSNLTYKGTLINTFDTQINEDDRNQNITIIGEPTFKKWVKAEYDNTNATLNIISGEVTDQNSKIAHITQSVDEINSKISDTIDLTVSGETNSATLDIDNINASEPIQIVIKPIISSITNLYPATNLYPNSTLYPQSRTLRFYNRTTSENIDYMLPDDLLYYDSENYDEFTLDYGDGTPLTQICRVTKKCKYKADGTIELLPTPQTINYTYPSINLTNGDYTISLLGVAQGYFFVRLMAQNIYTTQFYTKAETNSIINQTELGIMLEVNEKVGSDEIIAKLNLAVQGEQGIINLTGNSVTINSDNFTLDKYGNTTMHSANITGGNIQIETEGSVEDIQSQQQQSKVEVYNNTTLLNSKLYPDGLLFSYNDDVYSARTILTRNTVLCASGDYQNNEGFYTSISASNIYCVYHESEIPGYQQTRINHAFIRTPELIQTSCEESKKNFEKFNNATNIIKNIDIYKYHLKSQKEDEKKHIGFVIGDNYNYSKEITSNDNQSVDLYSFISLCCQAIKEQQEIIEELQQRIEKLERESDK